MKARDKVEVPNLKKYPTCPTCMRIMPNGVCTKKACMKEAAKAK